MKLFLIKIIVLLSICLPTSGVFAGIVVDCGGMTYSNLMVYASNLNMQSVQALVISSPFKAYEKTLSALDGPVFDFSDAGGKFQRGTVPTYLGDEASLRALAQYLWTRNIALYAKVDLFHQSRGYNRFIWKDSDFLRDNLIYRKQMIVDIGSSSARGALSDAIGWMRRLPVQKWVVDVKDIPADLRQEYVQFLTGSMGSAVIVLSDGDQTVAQVAHVEDYYTLRTNAFFPLKPDFRSLERFRASSGYLHYIDSESSLVNNTGPLLFLLLQNCNVMLSYKMLNRYHQSLIDYVRDFGGYAIETVSTAGEDKLLVYNQDKLIAVNYSDSFSVWKQKKKTWRKGFFKSLASGATLGIDDTDMTFFMFPKSIAFWDLRK